MKLLKGDPGLHSSGVARGPCKFALVTRTSPGGTVNSQDTQRFPLGSNSQVSFVYSKPSGDFLLIPVEASSVSRSSNSWISKITMPRDPERWFTGCGLTNIGPLTLLLSRVHHPMLRINHLDHYFILRGRSPLAAAFYPTVKLFLGQYLARWMCFPQL